MAQTKNRSGRSTHKKTSRRKRVHIPRHYRKYGNTIKSVGPYSYIKSVSSPT